jgi:hypothetical protein
MAIPPGILLNFPLARSTPEVWQFGVRPRGLIIRAYDLYRRQAPADDLRIAIGYDDPAGILILDKGGLSGDIYDIDLAGAQYTVEAQGADDFGEQQHERNFHLLSDAAARLGPRLVPVVPAISERMIGEYARFLQVLGEKYLDSKSFDCVALDVVRYATKGSGALGRQHYEDLAAMTAAGRRLLGSDCRLLVAGLSPGSMLVASHAGADLLGALAWVSSANYGRLLLSTSEQFLPADLEKKLLKEKLASCSCPVCDIESEYAKPVLEYLELKPRPSNERFLIYKQRSPAGFRARCIHNAHALIEMVDKVRKTIALNEGKPTASSFISMGFHLPGPVLAGLRVVDRLRSSRVS